jgi:hypothetical protein
MNDFWATLSGVVALIIGLAVVAVVLSPKATTSQVIQSGSSGLASLITAATSPVTGGGATGFGGTYSPSFGFG